jgi:16S rRNA processing protein RimM
MFYQVVDPYLEIGVVTRAHGLGGQLRVKLFAAAEDVLEQVRAVRLRHADGREQDHDIRRVQPGSKGLPVLELAGCTNRNAAEALRGAAVLVHRDALPPLQTDEFYLADTVGCAVELADGTSLGRVAEIGDNGAQPLLMIRHGERLYNVPAVPEFVVDFDGQRLVLELPDGLLEAVSTRAPKADDPTRDRE